MIREKISTRKDEDLRPWTSDDEMEGVLDKAYQALQTGFKRTAPMSKGGAFGMSPLDRRPAVLDEIEELIRHPERFGNEHSGIRSTRTQKVSRKKGAPTSNNPDDMKSSSTRDILKKTNYFMSSALDGRSAKKLVRNKKNPIKACYQLDAIRYEKNRKGPAVFNMSTADYQKFLARLSSKGLNIDELLRRHMEAQAENENGRDIYDDAEEYEEEYVEESKDAFDNGEESQPVAAEETDFSEGDMAKPLTEVLPLIRPTSVPTLESVTGGIFKDAPPTSRPSSARPTSRPVSAGSTRRDKKRADDEISAANSTITGISMAIPTPGGAGSRVRPSTGDRSRRTNSGWLKVEGAGVEEHKPAMPAAVATEAARPPRPASAAPSMSISRDGAFTLFAAEPGPKSDVDKLFEIATKAEAEAKVHQAESRVQSKSNRVRMDLGVDSGDITGTLTNTSGVSTNTLTSAMADLSIDPKTGQPRILSHKRIKELKSLRALMMTAAGSVTLNVHPDTSQDCVEENKRMKEVMRRCIQDCIERNHTDHTGPLLCTPGFVESIGPSKFYQSEEHRGYEYNERFEAAVRERDAKHGIKMDPLRHFVENAARNKQKLFQSGGAAMKFH